MTDGKRTHCFVYVVGPPAANSNRDLEGNLLKDQPERVALMRFHQGVCLQEAGKLAEARAQFDSIAPIVPGMLSHGMSIPRSSKRRSSFGFSMATPPLSVVTGDAIFKSRHEVQRLLPM